MVLYKSTFFAFTFTYVAEMSESKSSDPIASGCDALEFKQEVKVI